MVCTLFAIPMCGKYSSHIGNTKLSLIITQVVQLILTKMFQHIHTTRNIKCFSCNIEREMKEALNMLKIYLSKKAAWLWKKATLASNPWQCLLGCKIKRYNRLIITMLYENLVTPTFSSVCKKTAFRPWVKSQRRRQCL